MSVSLQRRDVSLILALGVVVMGAGLGLRNPWPADEPVFALISRDMLASGNWLIPMVGVTISRTSRRCCSGCRPQATGSRVRSRSGSCCLRCWRVWHIAAGLRSRAQIVEPRGRPACRAAAAGHRAVRLAGAPRPSRMRLLMFFTVLSLYCLLRQLLAGWRLALGAGCGRRSGAGRAHQGGRIFLVHRAGSLAVRRVARLAARGMATTMGHVGGGRGLPVRW